MSDWTHTEKAVVVEAVRAAPSVHNTQPWVLEFHEDGAHGVSLFRRWDRLLPHHDPRARDQLISCGAALATLLLAVRALGWEPEPELLSGSAHPDEVARIVARDRRAPTEAELARYAAVFGRRSHRRPFAATPVDPAMKHELTTAANTAGVEVRDVRADEIPVLARVFSHAALVLRMDRAYQRELSAWTAVGPVPAPGEGVAAVPARLTTLPWAGLVRRSTAVPDLPTLTDRLRHECVLLVETPGDGRLDHVRAGMTAQTTWLAATAAGLAGSLLTQPLQVREVRAGLIEGLALPGYPQALMRFGHPAGTRTEGIKEEPS